MYIVSNADNWGNFYYKVRQPSVPTLETPRSKRQWRNQHTSMEKTHDDRDVQAEGEESEKDVGKHSPKQSTAQEAKQRDGANKIYNLDDTLA